MHLVETEYRYERMDLVALCNEDNNSLTGYVRDREQNSYLIYDKEWTEAELRERRVRGIRPSHVTL